jgi:hypothetical protein
LNEIPGSQSVVNESDEPEAAVLPTCFPAHADVVPLGVVFERRYS